MGFFENNLTLGNRLKLIICLWISFAVLVNVLWFTIGWAQECGKMNGSWMKTDQCYDPVEMTELLDHPQVAGLSPAMMGSVPVAAGGGDVPTYGGFLGSGSDSGGDHVTITLAGTSTATNLIIVGVTWQGGAGVAFSVADSKSNTYNPLTERVNGSAAGVQLFYAVNTTALAVSDTITATNANHATNPAEYMSIGGIQVGGIGATATFTSGEENYGSGAGGTNLQTSSFNTATANSILVYVGMDDVGTSYTQQDSWNEVLDGEYSAVMAYKIVSSTGAYTGHAHSAATITNWVITAAAFHN